MASIISAGTTSGTSLNLSGDTSGVLQLATNGSTTAVTISTGQLVGIGTTSPDGLLTLPATASNTPKIRLQSATSDVDVTISSYADSSGTYAAFGSNFYLNSTGDEAVFDSAKRSSFIRVDGRNTGAITFGTATTGVTAERMRIDSSGNVGIGGTSLGGILEVFQGTTGSNFRHGSGTYFNISTGAANGTVDLKFDATSGNYPAGTFYTGGSERMRIDSSGRVTTPAQPAFMAYLNNSFTNASPQTIVFDITQFNTGSNYSTSTGRFTAPVTGLYQFNIVVLVQGSSATMHDFSLQVNGSNYKNGRINAPDSTVNYSCAIRLNANDYVSVYVSSTGRPIYGASDWTYFSGFLVG